VAAPRILIQTTTDSTGAVVDERHLYEWDADGEVPAYRDSLDVGPGSFWESVSKTQRLNEMKARKKRRDETILTPPPPEEIDQNQALRDALDALNAAQSAVEAALPTGE
jgi:hypothetical protein